MRLAIIGTGDLPIGELQDHLPEGTTVLLPAGDAEIAHQALRAARRLGLPQPDYYPYEETHGACGPYLRVVRVLLSADRALIFWNGRSPVVLFAIEVAHDLHVPAKVLRPRVQRGPALIPVPAEERDALYAGGRRRAAAEAHGSDWITLD